MGKFVDKLKSIPGFQSLNGVDDCVILSAEDTLKLKFSSEYKDFLKTFGIVRVDGHEFVGLGSSERLDVVYNTLSEREINKDIPGNFYVIEQGLVDGILIWQDSTGTVYESIPEDGYKKVASSLYDYLQ